MDTSTAVAFAVTLAADRLCGGSAPREVVVLCVWCLEEADPGWTWSTHRAPDHAECAGCVDPRRRADGLCFVVRPKTT